MDTKWQKSQELIDKYEEMYENSLNAKLRYNTPSSCFTKVTDSDKADEILFALDGMAKKMVTRGIPKSYILRLRLSEWNKMVKYLSLSKILGAFRRSGIKGADVFTSYGVKKIRIWL